jgi:branched-chain amino acid aminotransferase
MPVPKTEKIWHNGKFIHWDDAKIHVLSHVIHYGSGVFEGIRCYETTQGPAVFRLKDHMQRLVDSGRMYRMDLAYSVDQLCQAALELVRANKMSACYIRPIAFRGYGEVGVDPRGCPMELYMACWEWGKYLGEEGLGKGIDVCVSSWNRPAPNTLPQMAKSSANYMNSQLIRMEAKTNGFEEGIGLDHNGHIAEGSGENIFVVRKGVVFTPTLADAGLSGITRDSVLAICQDLGIPVREQAIPREMLYVADEVFFSGTAAEITPIRSVDHIQVSSGSRGPVAKRIQEEFFAITSGKQHDRHGWLSPVGVPTTTAAR